MPVFTSAEIRPINQAEFGRIAYGVMNHVFAVHLDLGRFFDEDIYRDVLATRCQGAETEVRIEVRFDDFVKLYFIDLLVDGGAPFELKTVHALNQRHRSQILNYLMLSGLSHGKLISFRTEYVQHEFLNSHVTLATRRKFQIDTIEWQEPQTGRGSLQSWFGRFVEDIGTGLDTQLYTAAVTHFLGGEQSVVRTVEITDSGRRIGTQNIGLANDDWAIRVTTIPESGFPMFREHLCRLLSHTRLTGCLWINVTGNRVAFQSVRK